jgi:hypothetical protein
MENIALKKAEDEAMERKATYIDGLFHVPLIIGV